MKLKDIFIAALITVVGTIATLLQEHLKEDKVSLPIQWIASIATVFVGSMLVLLLFGAINKTKRGRQLLQITGCQLEGQWLEVLERKGEIHYSLFTFFFDGENNQYTIKGTSFYPAGDIHTEWGTIPFNAVDDGRSISIDYIYDSYPPTSTTASPPTSTFRATVRSKGSGKFEFEKKNGVFTTRSGYYLSEEQKKGVYTKVNFTLHRITEDLKKKHGEDLKDGASECRFVKALEGKRQSHQGGGNWL